MQPLTIGSYTRGETNEWKPEHVVPSKEEEIHLHLQTHQFRGSISVSFSVGGFHQICSGFVFHQLFGHFPGVLEEEVDALDFAHNVLGLAEAEPDESQA